MSTARYSKSFRNSQDDTINRASIPICKRQENSELSLKIADFEKPSIFLKRLSWLNAGQTRGKSSIKSIFSGVSFFALAFLRSRASCVHYETDKRSMPSEI